MKRQGNNEVCQLAAMGIKSGYVPRKDKRNKG